MKKIIFILFFSAILIIAHSQMPAYFSHCAFSTPENKPYIETYLSVLGHSVVFKKNKNGKYQAKVNVEIIFSKDSMIKASKKFTLLSPEINDTINRPDFIDEQRFPIDTGKYQLEMMIADKNINGKTFSMKQDVFVRFPDSKINISDILLSSYSKSEKQNILTKNGFDMIPYVSDFYPDNVNDFTFYAEVYNTETVLGDKQSFLINYFIQSYESKVVFSNYASFRRETSAPVNVVLSKFNISELPSGNYDFVIQVKDKNNKLVAQRSIFFQRSNTKLKTADNDFSNVTVENTFASKFHGDTLREFIRCLRPISSVSEKSFADNQLKIADEKLMQQFFYNFWRNQSASHSPEESWNLYFQDVKAVNKKFGTLIHKGYETDRGRIYLQYGHPDKREVFPSEPNAYPYEIWVYYKLDDKSKLNPPQTNKEFIFYDPNLATNDYPLLNSNALGEINDADWEMKLQSRMNQTNDMEQLTSPEHYGGDAHDEFTNPK